MLVCSTVGGAATFLPWATAGELSLPGTKGAGWVSLALFALPLLFSLAGRRRQPVIMPLRITTFFLGAGAAGWGGLTAMGLDAAMKESDPYLDAVVSIGPGLWLVIVAGVALAILPYVVGSGQKATSAVPATAG
jgi:hypothetical protein